MPSPFLTPSTRSKSDEPALLYLRRDLTTPTILRTYDDENLGYQEGKVANTRFGSFPHSTLIDQSWGSQIIASKVDTGSRGRKNKRKAAELDSPAAEENNDGAKPLKTVQAASSGFLHLLCPTPETWTISLPHRTQVVYTPDYSYILHRLQARPGGTVIEAGAGSGSFTHAAARAVFNGYPPSEAEAATPAIKKRRLGKVCSFEFHEQRAGRVRDEIRDHGLDGIVKVTHRDVYENGFLLGDPKTGNSPKANAIFLDLPAPWLALRHLVRNPPDGSESPLDSAAPAYICTFSPCLEQAQRTISTLRQMSWLSIEMVEVSHRRIEVRRERYGLESEGQRGAIVFPKDVDEAVGKLRAVEERASRFRELRAAQQSDGDSTPAAVKAEAENEAEAPHEETAEFTATTTSTAPATPAAKQVPSYASGRLIHRTEPDLKTHTSYLVFAVLPREWTDEDEKRCRKTWPSQSTNQPGSRQKSKKQQKREAKAHNDQEPAKENAPEQTEQ